MTKIYKLILVCCAALFLSACAHPDMIKLNDTYDYTVKELGVPDSTTRLPDGSIRFESFIPCSRWARLPT